MVCEKYVASGNDFLIFHSFCEDNRHELARRLCDRHNGIGADGLIVILPDKSLPEHQKCDFMWEFYNRDGSVASMCGNGSRAAAMYAFRHGLCGDNLCFRSHAGMIKAKILESTALDSTKVLVEFTPPKILHSSLIECNKQAWLLDTGVPHLVIFVQTPIECKHIDKQHLKHLRDKYDANINVAYIHDNAIFVRTFERGVEDETLACGTGMAASFVVAYQQNLVREKTIVIPASGEELEFFRTHDGVLSFAGLVRRVGMCYIENL